MSQTYGMAPERLKETRIALPSLSHEVQNTSKQKKLSVGVAVESLWGECRSADWTQPLCYQPRCVIHTWLLLKCNSINHLCVHYVIHRPRVCGTSYANACTAHPRCALAAMQFAKVGLFKGSHRHTRTHQHNGRLGREVFVCECVRERDT